MGGSWHQGGPGLQSESSHADTAAGGPLLSELPDVREQGDGPASDPWCREDYTPETRADSEWQLKPVLRAPLSMELGHRRMPR